MYFRVCLTKLIGKHRIFFLKEYFSTEIINWLYLFFFFQQPDVFNAKRNSESVEVQPGGTLLLWSQNVVTNLMAQLRWNNRVCGWTLM